MLKYHVALCTAGVVVVYCSVRGHERVDRRERRDCGEELRWRPIQEYRAQGLTVL